MIWIGVAAATIRAPVFVSVILITRSGHPGTAIRLAGMDPVTWLPDAVSSTASDISTVPGQYRYISAIAPVASV